MYGLILFQTQNYGQVSLLTIYPLLHLSVSCSNGLIRDLQPLVLVYSSSVHKACGFDQGEKQNLMENNLWRILDAI